MKKKLSSLLHPDKSLRTGGYSFAVAAVCVAIAIAANLFVSALPESFTKIDVTSGGLYSLSEQTESIVSSLQENVDIYWIVQAGQEDEIMGTLLGRYESLSKKVHITKKDPDVYPTFCSQYTSDKIYNNSLIVSSGNRNKYISYSGIYEYDYSSYYSTGAASVSFAGETQLTSAIDYVCRSSAPVLYQLSGHGEAELSSEFTSAIARDNIEIQTLDLISENRIPEDASCILINSPVKDISSEECSLLKAGLSDGKSIILITDPPEATGSRANIDTLAAYAGMQETEGILVEADSNYYAYGMPYYLLPDYGSHEITAPLSGGGYHVLLPVSHGIELLDECESGAEGKILLQTSDKAYSKLAGYEMENYERESGDPEGQFALSAISEVNTANGKACFVWVASASVLDDMTNMQTAGGNEDFILNCLSYLCGEESSISIRSKNLSNEYLSLSSSEAAVIRTVITAVIPLAFLICGIAVSVRRKRR